MRLIKVFFILSFLITLLSCAHVISDESLRTIDRNVKVENIFTEAENYKGRNVLLGGMIINVTNEERATYIEVLEKPLDFRGYPEDTDISRGRFLVYYEGFLDSAVYSRGKYITVVGEIIGTTVGKIEKAEYKYPVIKSRELKLVRLSERGGQPTFHFGIGIFKGF
ncbi:MAG: Slp family lipoprotein [Proteobacteria bacterium]|nr:Slp family lipoprotein [Pseudomonadota bacterium]